MNNLHFNLHFNYLQGGTMSSIFPIRRYGRTYAQNPIDIFSAFDDSSGSLLSTYFFLFLK